jgi:hypothetical protein
MRRSARLGVIAALSATIVACSGSPSGPSGPATTTFLSFKSDPGDYIGAGQSHSYALADGTWNTLADFGDTRTTNHVRVTVQNIAVAGWWWDVDLAAPKGQMLAVGAYEDARRYPFQPTTQPGLNFDGTGRGCNTLTGRFVILDLALGPGNTVDRLHATFEQHCEGGSPALTGEISVAANPWR